MSIRRFPDFCFALGSVRDLTRTFGYLRFVLSHAPFFKLRRHAKDFHIFLNRFRHVTEPAARPDKGTRDRSTKPVLATEKEALMKECPWLRDSDFGLPKRRRRVSPDETLDREPIEAEDESEDAVELGDQSDEVDDPDDPAPEDHDVDVETELAAIRARWEVDVAEEHWFYHRVLGGRWTSANRGVVADGVSGYPRGGLAQQWCNKFIWPRQFGCTYAAHGQEDSHQIVREWVRRCTFFFSMWHDAGCPDNFVYSPFQRTSYRQSLQYLDWVVELPVESATFERALVVNRLEPSA